MTRVHAEVMTVLPLRIVSVANVREHHMVKHRRTQEHRAVAHMMLGPLAFAVRGDGIYDVWLTRVRGPRGKALDDDNLRSGLKAVRDGVADALGVDDGSWRTRWHYDEEQGTSWAVRVRVTRDLVQTSAPRRAAPPQPTDGEAVVSQWTREKSPARPRGPKIRRVSR